MRYRRQKPSEPARTASEEKPAETQVRVGSMAEAWVKINEERGIDVSENAVVRKDGESGDDRPSEPADASSAKDRPEDSSEER